VAFKQAKFWDCLWVVNMCVYCTRQAGSNVTSSSSMCSRADAHLWVRLLQKSSTCCRENVDRSSPRSNTSSLVFCKFQQKQSELNSNHSTTYHTINCTPKVISSVGIPKCKLRVYIQIHVQFTEMSAINLKIKHIDCCDSQHLDQALWQDQYVKWNVFV